MAYIKFCDITFCFDSREENSIDGISFDLKPGETLVLAGRSGSGKSTLLHCLSGLIPEYYSGRLDGVIEIGNSVDGVKDWKDVPLSEKSKMVGTVFQDPRHQFFSARVEQELLLSMWRNKATLDDKQKHIDLILGQLGMEDFRYRILDTLSSGEQQRIGIGTAISSEPEILVFDEPSANLSPDGIESLIHFLQRAKEQGITIIIAEHRFLWLRELTDKLLVLDQGRVVYQGDVSKLDDAVFCRQHGLRFHDAAISGVIVRHGENNTEKTGNKKYNDLSVLFTLDQVGFRYKKHLDWIWRHVNASFHGGEVIALTGKNGCGKTTMLALLFGLYKPVEGSINFLRNDFIRAMALQHPDLQLFYSTVKEEISSSPEVQEEWMGRFNLSHIHNRHPLTLSGGEMQRLVLAVSFARISERKDGVLLLDEPTSGMDGQQLDILSLEIGKIQADNKCVIMATHDSDLIRKTGAVTMQVGVQETGDRG